jgi:hypothetical protein
MIHHLRALTAKLRGLFGDRKADQELDDEIEAHLRLLTERYVSQGMSEYEAAWAARQQFGNVTLLQEANRDLRTRCPSLNRNRCSGEVWNPRTHSLGRRSLLS